MHKIDSGYDILLGSNFELHKSSLFELKTLAKSWYKGVDFSKFDERFVREGEHYEREFIEMKKSGLLTNYFFVYKEGNDFYLMDGFNRLFTNYGSIDFDCRVYVKILTDKLADNQLMRVMFHLNMWKLQGDGHYNFKPNDFFDRGFRLFLHKKFDIDLYSYKNIEYKSRARDNHDVSLLYYYFRNEQSYSGDFALPLFGIRKVFENENIITDLKDLIKANDYIEQPFKNYTMFLQGYAMFLAWRRTNEDKKHYDFETYLNKLKEDKKFFKKLQGMSGTDSTRINIYNFFRDLYKNNK